MTDEIYQVDERTALHEGGRDVGSFAASLVQSLGWEGKEISGDKAELVFLQSQQVVQDFIGRTMPDWKQYFGANVAPSGDFSVGRTAVALGLRDFMAHFLTEAHFNEMAAAQAGKRDFSREIAWVAQKETRLNYLLPNPGKSRNALKSLYDWDLISKDLDLAHEGKAPLDVLTRLGYRYAHARFVQEIKQTGKNPTQLRAKPQVLASVFADIIASAPRTLSDFTKAWNS